MIVSHFSIEHGWLPLCMPSWEGLRVGREGDPREGREGGPREGRKGHREERQGREVDPR